MMKNEYYDAKETVRQAAMEIAGLIDDHMDGEIRMETLELLQLHITRLENYINPMKVPNWQHHSNKPPKYKKHVRIIQAAKKRTKQLIKKLTAQ